MAFGRLISNIGIRTIIKNNYPILVIAKKLLATAAIHLSFKA